MAITNSSIRRLEKKSGINQRKTILVWEDKESKIHYEGKVFEGLQDFYEKSSIHSADLIIQIIHWV